MGRPVLFVLAGVNGAGKSSIGGLQLEQQNLTWFNPDSFARDVKSALQCDQETANGEAWQEGFRRLNAAIDGGSSFAFETTLGGNSIPSRLRDATGSHDVIIWFCGLDSVEHHLARVKQRVENGGHDIPEDKIRARYPKALENLIDLLTHIAEVQVYDNSVDVPVGNDVPDPVLVLHVRRGKRIWPLDRQDLEQTPDWAKPVVGATMGS